MMNQMTDAQAQWDKACKTLDEDATIHFNRLTVWAARMVDPTRRIAAVQTINHARVVDVKVKRVLGITGVMRMAMLRLGHRNDFPHVLNDSLTCGHVTQGKHALAMDARGEDLDSRLAWCAHGASGFVCHSTVTDLAKLRGLSTSVPRAQAV